MSDVDVEALTALLAKATPGPWRVSDEREDCPPDESFAALLSHGMPESGGFPEVAQFFGKVPYRDVEGITNAELIAAMHTALPALLSELKALRKVRDAARETSKLGRSLIGFEVGSLHPNDLALKELETALADLPKEGGK